MREIVERFIANPADRWYPKLATQLANVCWSALADFGLNPSNYSTLGALRCDPKIDDSASPLSDTGWGRPLRIEAFVGELALIYGDVGLRQPSPFVPDDLASRLREAMALLDVAPTIGEAGRSLVWALVPVDVEGAEYDTGYSDPAVPFSIFIGLHPGRDRVPAIRLAEGVLHEAMHLQLSLIEDVLPLVGGSTDLRISPWQRRPRPMQGLLHGLYVFRVIQDWLSQLLQKDALNAHEYAHARKRLAEIEDECITLGGIVNSPDLTRHGRVLASSLAIGPAFARRLL